MPRPSVLVKCAISIDGYLDDASDRRLILSHPDDLDRADAVRASCDAICVGANTIRRDNPALCVKSADRRRERVARGVSPDPVKVTMTRSGKFDPRARFFTEGNSSRLVYCTSGIVEDLRAAVGRLSEIVPLGDKGVDVPRMLIDLHRRGIRKLLVEGGSDTLSQFLSLDLVDELQVSIAPVFVGDARAPRFTNSNTFPFSASRRMILDSVERVGDMALLTYFLDRR